MVRIPKKGFRVPLRTLTPILRSEKANKEREMQTISRQMMKKKRRVR